MRCVFSWELRIVLVMKYMYLSNYIHLSIRSFYSSQSQEPEVEGIWQEVGVKQLPIVIIVLRKNQSNQTIIYVLK